MHAFDLKHNEECFYQRISLGSPMGCLLQGCVPDPRPEAGGRVRVLHQLLQPADRRDGGHRKV